MKLDFPQNKEYVHQILASHFKSNVTSFFCIIGERFFFYIENDLRESREIQSKSFKNAKEKLEYITGKLSFKKSSADL